MVPVGKGVKMVDELKKVAETRTFEVLNLCELGFFYGPDRIQETMLSVVSGW